MSVSSNGDVGRLDPVIAAALTQLRSFTYRRRRLQSTAPFVVGLSRVPVAERHQLERLAGVRYRLPLGENLDHRLARAARRVRARVTDLLNVIWAITHLRVEDREKSLKDPGARSGAIHIFKHLKHHGYTWSPDRIRAWAMNHGFTAEDARQLSEYAEGVQAGTRYHTQPDPFGRDAIIYWRQNAESTEGAGRGEDR